MNRLVVDASVILKWVLPPGTEAHEQQAWAIADAARQGKVDLKVPSLWLYEVGNLLARRYPDHAAGQLSDLLMTLGPGEAAGDTNWLRVVLDLTNRCRVTFYDATYHALAIVNQGVFVTADEKYLQAVAGESHIMHLKDWR